jgi:MYXO-CTERM domain-containing protein
VSTPSTPNTPNTPSAPADSRHNGTSPSGPASDPEAIRADIERTREDLAETVDALHAKLDVKTRAKNQVARVKDSATTATGQPRPEVIGAAVAALLLVAGLVWWRRR